MVIASIWSWDIDRGGLQSLMQSLDSVRIATRNWHQVDSGFVEQDTSGFSRSRAPSHALALAAGELAR